MSEKEEKNKRKKLCSANTIWMDVIDPLSETIDAFF